MKTLIIILTVEFGLMASVHCICKTYLFDECFSTLSHHVKDVKLETNIKCNVTQTFINCLHITKCPVPYKKKVLSDIISSLHVRDIFKECCPAYLECNKSLSELNKLDMTSHGALEHRCNLLKSRFTCLDRIKCNDYPDIRRLFIDISKGQYDVCYAKLKGVHQGQDRKFGHSKASGVTMSACTVFLVIMAVILN